VNYSEKSTLNVSTSSHFCEIPLNKPMKFIQNRGFSTGQFQKKETYFDFIFTQFAIYVLLFLWARNHLEGISFLLGRLRNTLIPI